jgi:hypothetical protein
MEVIMSVFTRASVLGALVLCASFSALSGCATSPGDLGDTSSADLRSGSCGLSREQILAAAEGGRKAAIERGFTWYDADVPYSQSDYHESYRTDCSGFISMAWELGTSYTTADFISDGSGWSHYNDYDSLAPADALVRRSDGSGHIVMFLGWDDAAKTEACVLEQANSSDNMQFRVRSRDSLQGSDYKALHATSLGAGGGSGAGNAGSSSSGGSSSGGSSSGGSSSGGSTGNEDPGNEDPGSEDEEE